MASACTGLVVASINLTSTFDNVLNEFQRIQLNSTNSTTNGDNLAALLQIEVLKLRLSRWRDAVIQLNQTEDPATKALNGSLLKIFLGNMEQILKQYETMPSSKPTELQGNNDVHWLIRTLQRLSLKHHGQVLQSNQPRWTINSTDTVNELTTTLTAIFDSLETSQLSGQLQRLRSEDASEISNHPQANAMDIQFIERSIIGVDPRFSQLLKFGGHQFVGSVARGSATLTQGDAFAVDYHGGAIGANHSYISTTVEGRAKVVQGNMYGFNPLGNP